MNIDLAVKYLASRIGKLEVYAGHRYRIMYMDANGNPGLLPAYGDTFQEALIEALRLRFGDDLIAVADKEMAEDREIVQNIYKDDIHTYNPFGK